MYPVSEEYIAARRSRVKEERITGIIRLADGTRISVDDSVLVQGSLTVSRKVCDSSKWDIGTMNYSTMKLRLKDNRAYDHEFGGALIRLRYGIVTAVAEDGTKTWEDVPLPPFYVDGQKVTRKRDLIYLTAYDPISRLDIDYPDTIPTTSLYDALSYVCARAGLGLGISEEEFNALPNADVKPDFSGESIQTCRDAAMWIAQAVQCSGFVDWRGLLMLRQYRYSGGNDYDRRFTAHERTTIEYSDTRTYLAYLQSYSAGSPKLYSKVTDFSSYADGPHIKEGAFSLPENPILNKLSAAQQDAVNQSYLDNRSEPTRYIKMSGFVDPAVEPLDKVAFTGGNIDVGQIINVATEIKWVYRGIGNIVCCSLSENTGSVSGEESSIAALSAAEPSVQATSDVLRAAPKSQVEKQLDEMRSCSGNIGKLIDIQGSAANAVFAAQQGVFAGIYANKPDGNRAFEMVAVDNGTFDITRGNDRISFGSSFVITHGGNSVMSVDETHIILTAGNGLNLLAQTGGLGISTLTLTPPSGYGDKLEITLTDYLNESGGPSIKLGGKSIECRSDGLYYGGRRLAFADESGG